MIENKSESEVDERPPSKSQRKRDMHALQDLGDQLVQLTKKQLSTIELPENLLTAILEIHDMPLREARRRHLQLIGKIMRHVDANEIINALEKLKQDKGFHVQQQHLIENWRDRLLSDEKHVLKEFIDAYPDIEIQKLRQLIREAKKEQSQNKPPAHTRKLFKFLRDVLAR